MLTLADAYLTDAERRAVDRFVAELRERLGDELVAVWLYGSRARGERTGPYSDIDLLVVVESRAPDRDQGISRLLWEIADREEAGSAAGFMPLIVDRTWLADRRAIRAFFIQNVDRDKLVLFGERDGLGEEEVEPELPQQGRMSRRSQEYMDRAKNKLRLVRLALENGIPNEAIAPAYEAMLNATQARLDLPGRQLLGGSCS
jgi:predicted nucleotidyltransferase